MAVYKVPQDVEADDKLLGPFSFRQFVYLMIVGGCVLLAWFLSGIFIGFAFIPVPFILFFGALALPIKKDQPMETYLAAVVSFNLKPRKRLWIPDGRESIVEITVPKKVEVQRIKDLSQEEARKRLGYLADVVDSGGWAVKGVGVGTSLNDTVYADAVNTEDILDPDTTIASNIDNLMAANDQKYRDDIINNMRNGFGQTFSGAKIENIRASGDGLVEAPTIDKSLHSKKEDVTPVDTSTTEESSVVVQPVYIETVQQETSANGAVKEEVVREEVSPAILNLVKNSDDLTVETIAREANRLEQKEKEEEDVYISLR